MTIKEIAQQIKVDSSDKQPPVLIAIDGFGGSGKSTIADTLKDELGDAYVIGIDDFIIKERLLEQSVDEVLFDRKRLLQQVLMPLRKGGSATYQRLEWEKNELSESITVPTVTYVIIEGISTTHPDISEYYDYKIWVDVPLEVAKQRGKLRDAGNENEQHWDLWAKNDAAYLAAYHPERYADFTVSNIE